MTSIPYLSRALRLQPLSKKEPRLICNGQAHVIRFIIAVASRSSRDGPILIADGVFVTEVSLQRMIDECNEAFPRWKPLPKVRTILVEVSKSKTGFNSINFNNADLIPAERQFDSLVEAAKRGEAKLGARYNAVHRVVRQAYDHYVADLKAVENGVPQATEAIVVDPDDIAAQQLLHQVIRLQNCIEQIHEKNDKAVADNLDDLRKGMLANMKTSPDSFKSWENFWISSQAQGTVPALSNAMWAPAPVPKRRRKELTIKLQNEKATLQSKIASLESEVEAKVKELNQEKESHKITEDGRQQQEREKFDAQYDVFNANIENTGLQEANDSLLSTVMQLEDENEELADENEELALLLKIYKQLLFYMEFLASLLAQPSRVDFTQVLM